MKLSTVPAERLQWHFKCCTWRSRTWVDNLPPTLTKYVSLKLNITLSSNFSSWTSSVFLQRLATGWFIPSKLNRPTSFKFKNFPPTQICIDVSSTEMSFKQWTQATNFTIILISSSNQSWHSFNLDICLNSQFTNSKEITLSSNCRAQRKESSKKGNMFNESRYSIHDWIMWHSAILRLLRRRIVLAIIFFFSLTYCVMNLLRNVSEVRIYEINC